MTGRLIKLGAKIILAVGLILVAAFFLFNSLIQKKIRQQFAELGPALRVTFSSIRIDMFASSVSLDSVSLTFTPYQTREQNSHHVYFSTASLRQVNFLKFLFNKKLVAKNFVLEDGRLQLDPFLLDKSDSAQSAVLEQIEWPFKRLLIKNVQLKNAKAFLRSVGKDHLLVQGDANISGVAIDKPRASPTFTGLDLRLSDLDCALPRYQIQASKLILNSNERIAAIESLRVFPRNNLHGETIISSIKISGLDIALLTASHTLDAEEIVIGKSNLVIDQTGKSQSRTLPFDLRKIHVEVFRVENAAISYRDDVSKCTFSGSVSLQQLKIDKPFQKKNIHFTSLRGNLSGVDYSGKGYHRAEIKSVELDSKKIRIGQLKVIPQLSKYELGRRLRHQADWIQANVATIEIIKPDINQLLQQTLLAEKIVISDGKAYIFRDRRLPRLQKIIPLPVDYLKSLPFDLRISTVQLTRSAVAYEEYPQGGYGQTGILRIERISASMSPVINHPLATDPDHITMAVKGSIMGSGTAHGLVVMPFAKSKPYRIKGAIERLELTKLNSSSENLGKIRIKSGFLDYLSFDFTMTEQHSTGKIVGAYHRLIIQQLKKHTEEKNVADFASFMLRHLIIPLNKDKSLPERKRTGLVNYQRDPSRFVSHYFLQSLLMGVKKSFTLGFLLPK